ncbi:MerR family transcriptional regulator [Streptococcus gordonii]|uniref:MerR family transcriptional regulator n=1 Tax=Streptococcus gordonii TaxID=1302 RepID=UPI001CBAB279|nr:MerR family transcriptional regulator [Streptococcus gordonii]MBZ2117238.1 MerR family transcriptional regulator [Streptococcus gordonii]
MNNEKLEQIEQLLQTLIKLIQIKEQNIPLKIIQQRELLKQLNISPNTLKTWEQKGLKRLEPPIEGTRTVFYLLDDIIDFLQP